MSTQTVPPISNKSEGSPPPPGYSSGIFSQWKNSGLVLLLILSAIGAVLRFHLLGAKSFWVDEASSVAFSRMPWPQFLRTMWYGEANMAFYYVLLRGWLHGGDSEFWLRSLSALFGIATIPAVYVLGKRFLNRETGLAAAALLAIHSFHLAYSQDLRSYTLLLFLLVLSSYFFLSAIASPQKGSLWICYAILSSLAIYTQVFSVFVLATQWFVLLMVRVWRRTPIQYLAGTALGMGIVALPMARVMTSQNKGQLDWIQPPSARTFLEVFQNIAGVAPEDAHVSWRSLIFAAVYLAICAFGVLLRLRRRNAGENPDMASVAVSLFTLWLFFPLVAMFVFSFAKPIFIPRYLVMCVPAAVLLAGFGLVAIKQAFGERVLSTLTFLLLVLFSSLATRDYFGAFATYGNDWLQVTRYILSRQQSQDAALFYTFSGHRVFDYYVQRQRETVGLDFSPTVILPSRLDSSSIERAAAGYRRVWLVLDRAAPTATELKTIETIRSSLLTHLRFAGERDFLGHIRVALYEGQSLPAAANP